MSSLLQQSCCFSHTPCREEVEEHVLALFPQSSDLEIYEDEKSVVIAASLPGLQPSEIEATADNGILLIRGCKKEEEREVEAAKQRHYHRQANRTYVYQIAVPGEIDERQEPKAELKNGVMTITFMKEKKEEPKRILIQT